MNSWAGSVQAWCMLQVFLVVVAGSVATVVGFLLDGVEHGEPGDLTEALHALFQELPNTSFRCLLDFAFDG